MANKPTSLARVEFISNLSSTINSSELPSFMVLDILNTIIADVKKIVEDQTRQDKEEYEKQLAEEANKVEKIDNAEVED